MIIVLGSVIGNDATIDELIEESLIHVRRSRSEPGCISHDVARDAENPNRLMFTERWADDAALKAHFAVPASAQFVAAARQLSDGRVEMSIHPAASA